MKYVLDEKDRARPWYKGMSNMDKGEIEEWFKKECKAAILLAVELLIFGLVGIMIWLTSPDDVNRDSILYLIVGVIVGMGFFLITMVTTEYRHVKLVKEEKEGSE